jgi:sec-independent protein translocase protein TatC
VPIILLYEISIIMAKMVEKKRAEAQGEDEYGDDDLDDLEDFDDDEGAEAKDEDDDKVPPAP